MHRGVQGWPERLGGVEVTEVTRDGRHSGISAGGLRREGEFLIFVMDFFRN